MKPTVGDLEVALVAQVYFAKRVTVADPKHAEFHREINHLLTEREELINQGLTRMNRLR